MKVMVTGRKGQLARALAALTSDDAEVVCVGRPELDFLDPRSVLASVEEHMPDVIVNAAAYTLVDQAEKEPQAAFSVNRDGAAGVAAAAAHAGLPVIQISTDYVFDGKKTDPYLEDDETAPQSVYGLSKRDGENAVLQRAGHKAMVLRTSWLYEASGRNFPNTMLRMAGERGSVRVVADQCGTPTYAPDLAEAILRICRHVTEEPSSERFQRVFHVVNSGATTWAGFAEELFRQSAARGGPFARVNRVTTADYPTPARRPANSRLDTSRFSTTFGSRLPDWRDGVARFIERVLD